MTDPRRLSPDNHPVPPPVATALARVAEAGLQRAQGNPHANIQIADVQRAIEAASGSGRVARPRFCATAGCEAEAEMVQGSEGWWRPGTYCTDCVKANREARATTALVAAIGSIDKRYRGMRFATQQILAKISPESLERAREAMHYQTLLVLIAGRAGVGKTILAAAMANAVLDAAVPGCDGRILARASRLRWTTAAKLGAARKESPLGGTPRILREATNASFLVIDELGRESGEEGSRAIWDVLDARHAAELPTVVTTFLRGQPLRDRYDGGILRRLLEKPHGVVIDLGK